MLSNANDAKLYHQVVQPKSKKRNGTLQQKENLLKLRFEWRLSIIWFSKYTSERGIDEYVVRDFLCCFEKKFSFVLNFDGLR